MNLTSILPSTSFASFKSRVVVRPTVLWRNETINITTELESFAFCIPMKGDPDAAYGKESRTFLAERYGGAGLGHNGGGARCGFASGVQVKGIGRTPVLAGGAGQWHSHGGASLQEGIREAVWGEVCHVGLPHGGVRVHGLISTGTTCPNETRMGTSTAPRVLIVRDAAIRPAHYMRACFFRPSPDFRAAQVSDTKRTESAVRSITSVFHSLYGTSNLPDIECINDGLTKMLKRAARQISEARAKRIMHGALSDSNICVDGSWVDYGTVSAISDYGRIILCRNSADLWHQHVPLTRTIYDLCFYLRKYLPRRVAAALVTSSDLIKSFNAYLNRYLALGYVKLIGIPVDAYPSCVTLSQEMNVYNCFHDITHAGNHEPFMLAPDRVKKMPQKMGTYSLNSLLRHTCMCRTTSEMEHSISNEIENNSLRRRFCETIWNMRESFLRSIDGRERDYMRVYIFLNALRVNSPFMRLYRPNLDRSIDGLLCCPEGIPSFISSIIDDANSFLTDAYGENINLSAIINDSNNIDPVFSRARFQSAWLRRLICNISPLTLRSEDYRMAEHYAIQSF